MPNLIHCGKSLSKKSISVMIKGLLCVSFFVFVNADDRLYYSWGCTPEECDEMEKKLPFYVNTERAKLARGERWKTDNRTKAEKYPMASVMHELSWTEDALTKAKLIQNYIFWNTSDFESHHPIKAGYNYSRGIFHITIEKPRASSCAEAWQNYASPYGVDFPLNPDPDIFEEPIFDHSRRNEMLKMWFSAKEIGCAFIRADHKYGVVCAIGPIDIVKERGIIYTYPLSRNYQGSGKPWCAGCKGVCQEA